MNFVTEQLAEFVNGVDFRDLPNEVVTTAERALLDTIAAAIGGVKTDNAAHTRQAALASFGMGNIAPWFSTDPSLHPLGALLSNCAAASSLDIDDGHCRAAGHPGAAIVPAVLMEADLRRENGQNTLAAIALGYDVALRIAETRRFTDTMSFASGRWTGYGVAAALGWLRGLPPGQLAHAIAIAGQEAPQNLPQGDCMTSSVKGSSPWSTVTASVAVERAAIGATGSIDLLDRPHAYDVAAITKDLGTRWLITETYLKPYAACRYIHPVIDAVLALTEAESAKDRRIDRLEIEIFPEAEKIPNDVAPTSLEAAQFSIPFTAALAAIRGASALRPLEEKSLSDTEVLALSRRVEVIYSVEFAGGFPGKTQARVKLVSGEFQMSKTVLYPLGDVSNPLDRSSVESKLYDLGRGFLGKDALTRIVDAVTSLQSDGPGPLIKTLALPAGVGSQSLAS